MVNRNDIARIVKHTIKGIDMYSVDAVSLLMKTGVVESGFRRIYQAPTGPGRSFWQIEPDTSLDNYTNFIKFRPVLYEKIKGVCHIFDIGSANHSELLEINLAFAICMARIKYYRVPKPLPKFDDLEGQAEYWLKYYNAGGKGTIQKFINSNL